MEREKKWKKGKEMGKGENTFMENYQTDFYLFEEI